MTAPNRLTLGSRKSTARQPLMRPPPSRAQSATPTLNSGRASPPDSITTTTTVPTKSPARSVNGGVKRKERDFEQDGGEEETNINVVVRCRGRSDREVRENSGVVVSTQGVRGSKVDLSMGPSALSNKTYNFDKVFSPAADQEMIFNDVVSPILDEVLGGFNCTIFAYGQTGTGKTYTMSGDITDQQPLPEAAGIIPRVLYALFDRLGDDEGENSVKCSFIELYNEELRDLLAQEDNAKLKIYDDNSKKGQTTTLVQGMEESHIKSASKGLELLRQGSYKRQVAATKCNDLSSRSHTVFTVTVYMKKTSDTGEDFVSAGKLNLVDLAGSENIQRSGAEHKRAAEAGLINKSLLTLGRVINALVEKSTHIPYRESKLTRLLQDSLGGRTKTCIVATLSPAKSNLEETISTLDYAFRAKNIRNKPQANQMVSKKTLLREFTAEIEKLKMELMATRQRNGVYLTQEAYEGITIESESRRILSEEQRDKIEIMETSLRNKVQELFTLTSNFNTLKKDNDVTRTELEGTNSLLEKTELVLSHTRKSLAEETYVRQAHQATEQRLRSVGGELLSTLETTTGDIRGLHAKLRRRSDLHAANRDVWDARRSHVASTAVGLDERLASLRTEQENMLGGVAARMQAFVAAELAELSASQAFLASKVEAFNASSAEVEAQTGRSRDDMLAVLGEIKTLRDDVKDKVGAGMHDLSLAAGRIGAGIAAELDAFHAQLHGAFAGLGREFKAIFEDASRQLAEQKTEAERLQTELTGANERLALANGEAEQALHSALAEERETASQERDELLSQIGAMISSSAAKQDARLQSRIDTFTTSTSASATTHAAAQQSYTHDMGTWSTRSASLLTHLSASRDAIKSKLKSDWSAANASSEAIKRTTDAVQGQTLSIAEAQMAAMDAQLASLDEIIARIKGETDAHHASHTESLARLASDVEAGYASVGGVMGTSADRTRVLDADVQTLLSSMSESILLTLAAEGDVRSALAELQTSRALTEYNPTGSTPAKTAYAYPLSLPRTEERDVLMEKMHGTRSPKMVRKDGRGVYVDSTSSSTVPDGAMDVDLPSTTTTGAAPVGLRELDPNTPLLDAREDPIDVNMQMEDQVTPLLTTEIPDASSLSSSSASTTSAGKTSSKIPAFGRSVSERPASLPSAATGLAMKAKSKRLTAPVGTTGEKENVVPGSLVGGEKVVEHNKTERRSGRLRGRGSD
ncbi:kinesin heavy chain [Myriangium duriaei CBS 260.36]|uniref:Kinesin heavy chain n=1 Tax=Myriangium duriaei CBS 260.36 TaxID=1168546 RepID=A0A9P4MD37_9PEZI|nr:kinesin heavy chain [Myriangium duriaei CBS 260.36]